MVLYICWQNTFMQNISPEIQAIRTDYGKMSLDEHSVDKNPLVQFTEWLNAAIHAKVIEPNAMNVSTINADGFPSSRIVLLRGVDTGLCFYTNYNSEKGHNISNDPKGCITFFWPDLERQIRITGTLAKVSAEESDAYFNSRPRQSQVGAWASDQSHVIADRVVLEQQEKDFEKKFEGVAVPRPPHWGGYRLTPVKFEFWQGRASRLHDRVRYSLLEGSWTIARLSP